LLSFFDDIEEGFYIDVGANDPVSGSITKLFYDLGWSGINIEPLPEMYKKLCDDRPLDYNLNIGISNKKGILDLHVADGLSTFSEKSILGEGGNKIQVEVNSLTNVVKGLDIENIDINFCKIDVEGFEKQVLESINFELFRPQIFVMESTIPNTIINIHKEWETILTDNEYSFILQKGVNRYYIDNNLPFLFDKANNFKDIENKYEIFYVNHIDFHDTYTWKIGSFILMPIFYLQNLIRYLKFNY